MSRTIVGTVEKTRAASPAVSTGRPHAAAQAALASRARRSRRLAGQDPRHSTDGSESESEQKFSTAEARRRRQQADLRRKLGQKRQLRSGRSFGIDDVARFTDQASSYMRRKVRVPKNVDFGTYTKTVSDSSREGMMAMGVDVLALRHWMFSETWSPPADNDDIKAGPETTHVEVSKGFFNGENEFKLKVVPNDLDFSRMTGRQVVNIFVGAERTMRETVLRHFNGRVSVRLLFREGEPSTSEVHRVGGTGLPTFDIVQRLVTIYDEEPDSDYDFGPDAAAQPWVDNRLMWKGRGAFVRPAHIGDNDKMDMTPIGLEYHLLVPPSGGMPKRKADSTWKKSGTMLTLENLDPKKWSKALVDCETTEGNQDCALRCLAYLHYRKTGRRVVHDDQVASIYDIRSQEDAARMLRSYKSRVTKKKLCAVVEDVMHLSVLIDPSRDLTTQVRVDELDCLCVKEALGYASRINVWCVDPVKGMVSIYKTVDNRQFVVEKPELAYDRYASKTYISEEEAQYQLDEENSRNSFDDLSSEAKVNHGLVDGFGAPPENVPTTWHHLLLHDNHYYAITCLASLLGKRYYCEECDVPFKDEDRHMCKSKCEKCYTKVCKRSDTIVTCSLCHRQFNGVECFDLHRIKRIRGTDKGYSVCDLRWECASSSCRGRVFDSKKYDRALHECGSVKQCWYCLKYTPTDSHTCFIRKPRPNTLPQAPKIFYYDFETCQDTGEHVVHYAVVQSSDGLQTWTFNDIDSFCQFAVQGLGQDDVRDENGEPLWGCDNVFIAHNGGRFDVLMIVRHLMTKRDYKIERIVKGRNNMQVKVFVESKVTAQEEAERLGKKRVKHGEYFAHPRRDLYYKSNMQAGKAVYFKDSINFISGALRKFPKTFGFKDAVGKGEFPYLFISERNLEYKGVVPHIQEFNVEAMSDERLREFLPWYYKRLRETCEDKSQADEAISYLEYSFHQVIGDDALESEENYELVYQGPWVYKEELDWYCRCDVEVLRQGCEKFRAQMMEIATMTNESKRRVTVHGKWYAPGEVLPRMDPFSFVTVASFIQQLFLRMFYEDKQLPAFEHDFEQWLRRGFAGGRTEAFSLYHLCQDLENESIQKVDFTSQYPHVNANGLYPVGVPEDVTTDERAQELGFEGLNHMVSSLLCTTTDEIDAVGNPDFKDGLFISELTFQAPKDLKVPVLWAKVPYKGKPTPGKSRKGTYKLVFDATEHVDAVVNSIELYTAIKQGYKFWNVRRVVWWDKSKVVRGLFKSYVNKFLKMKIAAESWPEGVSTVEEKDAYVKMVNAANPGLDLTVNDVLPAKNPVMRAVAKLCLNSLWGKFNQRSNLPQTEFMYPEQYGKYWAMMTDDDLSCKLTVLIENVVAELRYINTEEAIKSAKNVNICIGIFTTAQARNWLYTHMTKLDPEQLLYCDTDSIMYWRDKRIATHQTLATKESTLGALSDEFASKKGLACIEFVSGGPKNYGYKFVDLAAPTDKARHAIDLKIKGFNLHVGAYDPNSARNKLTYEHVKCMVISHALKTDEKKKWDALHAADEYDTSLFDWPEDFDECEETEMRSFIKGNLDLETITVLDQRFVKTADSRVISKEVERTYNYVYNKAVVDVAGSTAYHIRTVPFGYQLPG